MQSAENNSKSENLKDSQPTFGLPGNIKQIGSIEKDLKIYMEDYVHTYLFKFAKINASKEKLAVLIGKFLSIDNEDVLIINGALQGKFTSPEKGVETFTKESWDAFEKEAKHFFPGSEIVGWAHTQPGYGAFLMVRDEAYHKENFPEKHQVFYVLDPMEKTDAFFIHENANGIRKAKGYFIYYDKNENMQEYMMENPLTLPKDEVPENTERQGIVFDRLDAAKRIRSILKRKEISLKSKGKYGLMASAGAAFLVLFLIMGAGLIKNSDKINELEGKLNLLTGYSDTENVFAHSENEFLSVQTNYTPVTSPEPEVLEETVSSETEPLSEDEILCYYIVKEGDSLMYISRKYFGNTSMVERIAEVNNIKSPDTIYYGKKIAIPKS